MYKIGIDDQPFPATGCHRLMTQGEAESMALATTPFQVHFLPMAPTSDLRNSSMTSPAQSNIGEQYTNDY